MSLSNRLGALLGLALSVLAPVTVLNAGMVSRAEAKTETLTGERIEKFCASFPKVKAIAVKQAKAKGSDVANAADQLSAVLKAVSDKEAGKEVESAVREHGFSNVKEWASVGESIVRAYAHIKTGGIDEAAQKKLKKAIRKIEKNDFLSDSQKADLIKALRKGADEVLTPPPAENVAAVKPMVGKIEAVMQ